MDRRERINIRFNYKKFLRDLGVSFLFLFSDLFFKLNILFKIPNQFWKNIKSVNLNRKNYKENLYNKMNDFLLALLKFQLKMVFKSLKNEKSMLERHILFWIF